MNSALATAFVVASLFAGSEAQGGIKGQQFIYPPAPVPGTKGGAYWDNGGAGGGFYGGGGMGMGGGAFKGSMGTKGQIKGMPFQPFQPQQQQQQFPFPPMGPPQRPQLPPGQQQFFG